METTPEKPDPKELKEIMETWPKYDPDIPLLDMYELEQDGAWRKEHQN